MKSYKTFSEYLKELLPFLYLENLSIIPKNSFPDFFFVMHGAIEFKIGMKLYYEQLQTKFKFQYIW